LGKTLVERGYGLVYGGGNVGIMGEIANSVLAEGGEVIGVIPQVLFRKEVAHMGLADLRVVESMHQRKALMAELSDAFIALPGGAGTMEEFFEVWTWAQLGLHEKPCGLLNVSQYYRHLIGFIDYMVSEGLLRAEHRAMVLVEEDIDALLKRLESYQPPHVSKWIDLGNT
jgi:uncharacterized protein (TIGR00730 family)